MTISNASAYEMKVMAVAGYSKPWLAIYQNDSVFLQNQIQTRLHFHGFTQNPQTGAPFQPDYDFPWIDQSKTPTDAQLRHFVEAFGFQREVENFPDHLVIIPISRGHCDQYPELMEVANFDSAFQQVIRWLEIDQNKLNLTTVSAHSGGGKILAHLMGQASSSIFLSKATRSDFYDALYNDDDIIGVTRWMTTAGFIHSLRLFSVPDHEPAQRGDLLYHSMNGAELVKTTPIDGLNISSSLKTLSSGNQLMIIQEKNQQLDHWSLVKMAWVYYPLQVFHFVSVL